MTSMVILYLMKKDISNHRIFYQNRFINEYALKKKAKIPESCNHGVPDFLVEYRRTYVLNNLLELVR